MSMGDVIDLDKACGRELSEAEAARLRELGKSLNLREDDALWPLLAAMEYQRIYYEALPEKIAGASRAIMDGMATAAEKETAAAQARLTDSVVREARNLASRIQLGKIFSLAIAAIIGLFGYSALCMWAGFQLGVREVRPIYEILLIPWAPIGCACCTLIGVIYGVYAMKKAVAEEKYGKLHLLASVLLISGGLILFYLSIFPEIGTISYHIK